MMTEPGVQACCLRFGRASVMRSVRRTAYLPYLLFLLSSLLLVSVTLRKYTSLPEELVQKRSIHAAAAQTRRSGPLLYSPAGHPQHAGTKPGPVDLILITGYQRSGSTLIGDLIQQSEGTQYFFEPLHSVIGGPEDHPDEPMARISGLLQRFINCSFPHQAGYIEWMKSGPWHLEKMHLLLQHCQGDKGKCFDTDFISSVCLASKRRVIKSFFVPMRRVPEFMKTLNPAVRQRMRVVYLVRDPRAMMSSLHERAWCKAGCRDPRRLCRHMDQDLKAFYKLKKSMRHQLILLRYEDMNRFPGTVANQLFARLGLQYTAGIAQYVQEHTSVRRGDRRIGRDSLFQDPHLTLSRWIHKIKRPDAQTIQSECAATMQRLRYHRLPAPALPSKSPIPLNKLLGEVSRPLTAGPYYLL